MLTLMCPDRFILNKQFCALRFLGLCSSTWKRLTTSSTESMSRNWLVVCMMLNLVCEGSWNPQVSSFWPTPSHFLTLPLVFSVVINKKMLLPRVVSSSQLKSKGNHILTKDVALWINLNINGTPMTSRSHTHPSHTQNSRLLTSSLSLGVPVPHGDQCR